MSTGEAPMKTWYVEIAGDGAEMGELATDLTDPSCSIEIGDRVLLGSDRFKTCTTAGDVLRRAEIVVEALNGVAKLTVAARQPIRLRHRVIEVSQDGTRRSHVLASAHSHAMFRMKATLTGVGVDGLPIPPQESFATLAMRLDRTNSNIHRALDHYGAGTWGSFYKVFEIIKDDLGCEGELKKRNWVSWPNLKRFTRDAQAEGTAGKEARHAGSQYRSSSHPMTKGEAAALIGRLLRAWIESKR